MSPLIGYLIPILFAVSIFLFGFSFVPSKSLLTRQLEELDRRDLNVSDRERLALFEKMFSDENKVSLAKKLIEAGWYTVTPGAMGLRFCGCAVLGIAVDVLLWYSGVLNGMLLTIALLLFPIVVTYIPLWVLNNAAETRKNAIQKALPDFLDVISTTVQAGLSVNQAMAYAASAAPGPLGEEMKEVLSQVRLGRPRADALKSAAERVNQQTFKTVITSLTQAERLGGNIAHVLGELADDTRHHRAMLVEEAAAQLPVKLVFPMTLIMLPMIFVVIGGSIAVNYFVNLAPK